MSNALIAKTNNMTTNNENQPEMKAAEPVAAAPVNLDTFDWEAYEHDSNLYGESKEEIAAKYDQTLSNVQVGEVVEGTVIGLTKREVVSTSATSRKASFRSANSDITPNWP